MPAHEGLPVLALGADDVGRAARARPRVERHAHEHGVALLGVERGPDGRAVGRARIRVPPALVQRRPPQRHVERQRQLTLRIAVCATTV